MKRKRPKIVPLVLPDPNQEVIGILEDALERAKAGEFRQLAVAAVCVDGSGWQGWTPGDTMLAGAIARLFHRFNLAMDEIADA